MDRYHWKQIDAQPNCYEAIDTLLGKPVALVIQNGQQWQWARKTSMRVHGVPSSFGVSRTRELAKLDVLKGMPG